MQHCCESPLPSVLLERGGRPCHCCFAGCRLPVLHGGPGHQPALGGDFPVPARHPHSTADLATQSRTHTQRPSQLQRVGESKKSNWGRLVRCKGSLRASGGGLKLRMHRAGPSTSQLQGHAPGGARVWCVCAAIESPSPPPHHLHLHRRTFRAENPRKIFATRAETESIGKRKLSVTFPRSF